MKKEKYDALILTTEKTIFHGFVYHEPDYPKEWGVDLLMNSNTKRKKADIIPIMDIWVDPDILKDLREDV